VKAEYWARRCLEFVHDNLCSPITLMTSRDNKYFLLLVDDLSRYMWIVMIPFKDRAVAAIIKEIAPTTEASSPQGSSQSIVRLRACITDTHHPIAHSRTANIIEH
jgi:hypothetical protein